jgi:hypothetical protein
MPKASAGRFTQQALRFGFSALSAGHAPLFDWKAATPWWISSFVPNLEAELGLAHVREHDPDLWARSKG